MQRVFICDRKSTCPLFDHVWDWGVEASPSDISSLVFLFFQFSQSVDTAGARKGSAGGGDAKAKPQAAGVEGLTGGGREALRVVFEQPQPRRKGRRHKERIMRYANNINTLASRSARTKARGARRPRSVAMVTAANDTIRVALFCEVDFSADASRKIADDVLKAFVADYGTSLKSLEPKFEAEAKDQNEARSHLQYMSSFRAFLPRLKQIVADQPKSSMFRSPQPRSEATTRAGSRIEADQKILDMTGRPTGTDAQRSQSPIAAAIGSMSTQWGSPPQAQPRRRVTSAKHGTNPLSKSGASLDGKTTRSTGAATETVRSIVSIGGRSRAQTGASERTARSGHSSDGLKLSASKPLTHTSGSSRDDALLCAPALADDDTERSLVERSLIEQSLLHNTTSTEGTPSPRESRSIGSSLTGGSGTPIAAGWKT